MGCRRNEERRDVGLEGRRVLGARELRLLGGVGWEVVGWEELRGGDMVGGRMGCWGDLAVGFEGRDLRWGGEGGEGDS
jgi:hypothetical protein